MTTHLKQSELDALRDASLDKQRPATTRPTRHTVILDDNAKRALDWLGPTNLSRFLGELVCAAQVDLQHAFDCLARTPHLRSRAVVLISAIATGNHDAADAALRYVEDITGKDFAHQWSRYALTLGRVLRFSKRAETLTAQLLDGALQPNRKATRHA